MYVRQCLSVRNTAIIYMYVHQWFSVRNPAAQCREAQTREVDAAVNALVNARTWKASDWGGACGGANSRVVHLADYHVWLEGSLT